MGDEITNEKEAQRKNNQVNLNHQQTSSEKMLELASELGEKISKTTNEYWTAITTKKYTKNEKIAYQSFGVYLMAESSWQIWRNRQLTKIAQQARQLFSNVGIANQHITSMQTTFDRLLQPVVNYGKKGGYMDGRQWISLSPNKDYFQSVRNLQYYVTEGLKTSVKDIGHKLSAIGNYKGTNFTNFNINQTLKELTNLKNQLNNLQVNSAQTIQQLEQVITKLSAEMNNIGKNIHDKNKYQQSIKLAQKFIEAAKSRGDVANVAQLQRNLTTLIQKFQGAQNFLSDKGSPQQYNTAIQNLRQIVDNLKNTNIARYSRYVANQIKNLAGQARFYMQNRSVVQAMFAGAGALWTMGVAGIKAAVAGVGTIVAGVFTAKAAVIALVATTVVGIAAYLTNFKGFRDWLNDSVKSMYNTLTKSLGSLFKDQFIAKKEKKKLDKEKEQVAELPLIREKLIPINLEQVVDHSLNEPLKMAKSSFEYAKNVASANSKILHLDSYHECKIVVLKPYDQIFVTKVLQQGKLGHYHNKVAYFHLNADPFTRKITVHHIPKHEKFLFIPSKNNSMLVDAKESQNKIFKTELNQPTIFSPAIPIKKIEYLNQTYPNSTMNDWIADKDIMDDIATFTQTALSTSAKILTPAVFHSADALQKIVDMTLETQIVAKAKHAWDEYRYNNPDKMILLLSKKEKLKPDNKVILLGNKEGYQFVTP